MAVIVLLYTLLLMYLLAVCQSKSQKSSQTLHTGLSITSQDGSSMEKNLESFDGRCGIWCKQHESLDPFCLLLAVQAAAAGVTASMIFLSTLWAP